MSEMVTCAHRGCSREVDKSTGTVCGNSSYGCKEYFCTTHKDNYVELEDGTLLPICDSCEEDMLDSEKWYKDPIDNCIIKILG